MKKLSTLLIVLSISFSGYGQSSLHRNAEKYFNRFEFATAAHLYEKIVKKNPNDKEAKLRLEQCYKVLKYKGEVKTSTVSNSQRSKSEQAER